MRGSRCRFTTAGRTGDSTQSLQLVDISPHPMAFHRHLIFNGCPSLSKWPIKFDSWGLGQWLHTAPLIREDVNDGHRSNLISSGRAGGVGGARAVNYHFNRSEVKHKGWPAITLKYYNGLMVLLQHKPHFISLSENHDQSKHTWYGPKNSILSQSYIPEHKKGHCSGRTQPKVQH